MKVKKNNTNQEEIKWSTLIKKIIQLITTIKGVETEKKIQIDEGDIQILQKAEDIHILQGGRDTGDMIHQKENI